ncbi:MAG: hypothetical protein LBL76_09000 [Treponema sp.]|jgi:hypothetical protein|nr:hypothetical protein [Treponema sp.]
MKAKIKLIMVFVMVLLFGTLVVSFDDGINRWGGQIPKLNGIWERGFFTLVLDENNYTSKINNQDYGKGIIIHDGYNFKLIATHEWDHKNNQWIPCNEMVTGYYLIQNNRLQIFNITGIYTILNGIWEKTDKSEGQEIVFL